MGKVVNLQMNSWQLLTVTEGTDLLVSDKLMIVALAVIILIPLIAATIAKIKTFSEELEYLNLEVERTTGEEQQSWIRRRRKHWLTLIPFVKRKR